MPVETMNRDAEREIEWDCTRAVVRFYKCLDAKRFDELVALFDEEGVWVRLGQTLAGRSAIADAMRERGHDVVTCHVVTNIEVRVNDRQNAESDQYVTLYRSTSDAIPAPLEGALAIIHHKDVLVRSADGWKIAHKSSRTAMARI